MVLTANFYPSKVSSIDARAIKLTKNGYVNHVYFNDDSPDITLTSAFQPIFSIAHRRVIGYEALLRGHDKQRPHISPFELLQMPVCVKDHLRLDRTCRWLHAHNYARQEQPDTWLFINLNTQCLISERPDAGFMRELFESTGLAPHQIVIEILEHQVQGIKHLRELIDHFRSLGCLIAVDDFGAGHSNFDRIWELQPDIVKIDRNLVVRAAESSKVARMMKGIVSLIHEAGSLVVIEGVETKEQAKIAISCNADMLQGFYFAKPANAIHSSYDFSEKLDSCFNQFNCERENVVQFLEKQLGSFKTQFVETLQKFSSHASFTQAVSELLNDENVVMAYLLDEKGYQVGETQYSTVNKKLLSSRFDPLKSTKNCNWSHRYYHYRALNNIGELQVTRPYFSITGFHLCVTASQAIEVDGKIYVICCDIDWPEEYPFA